MGSMSVRIRKNPFVVVYIETLSVIPREICRGAVFHCATRHQSRVGQSQPDLLVQCACKSVRHLVVSQRFHHRKTNSKKTLQKIELSREVREE